MFFGDISVNKSEGALLAHTIRLPECIIKKGHSLNKTDIKTLSEAGYMSVVAAKLENHDVHEDSAAAQIATAMRGVHMSSSVAFTGRCNLVSSCDGVVVIDEEGINQINAVHESIAVATVSSYAVVKKGQALATVKIIPFSAPEESVQKVIGLLALQQVMRVETLQSKAVGLVLTHSPGFKLSLLDKAYRSFNTRLNDLGSTIHSHVECEHDKESIAVAVQQLLSDGCGMIIVCGATATVDRHDVVPSAITMAGGCVDYFGMPVDPGNLLLLAHHKDIPIIGAPGCARSLNINGFDWVLQRLLAGLEVAPSSIKGMGVGGLLVEMNSKKSVMNIHDENLRQKIG